MRFHHFKPLSEQRLDEINMSPASLRQLASKIEGAMAGLEFELVIRGMSSGDNSQTEPDYDADESCGDIDSIVEFFENGELNGPREIRRLREALEEEFFDWQSEKLNDAFDNVNLAELITQYFVDQEGLEGEELEQAVAAEIDNPGRVYDIVREEWEDEARAEFDEEKWLRREYRYMSDVEGSFMSTTGISWPYWTYGSTDGRDPGEVAADFESAIGRKVKLSDGYHDYSISRQGVGDDFYIAEPDSSIEGDDDEDAGLEFVSPPLSISDMLLDLRDVVKWCKQGNAYTNESTGLHMNISVPNYSQDNLDFIKLALLMGDDHVSSSFGRLGVHYAKSAMNIVKRTIQNRPEQAKELLDQMRQHLNTAASKIIHDGSTDKYTSINVKTGRVEFRSPGGNWLADFESGKVENTLLRFVVALDAAVDETKYKEEYAKKLYKLLAPADENTSTIGLFAKYVAGDMPKAALKSFVKQVQRTRSIKKDLAKGVGGKYWWDVRTGNSIIEVVASSEQEAKKVAAKNWGVDVNNPMVYSSYTAKPLRPFEPEDVGDEKVTATVGEPESAFGNVEQYEIYNTDTGEKLTSFFARGMGEALDRAEVELRMRNLGNASFNVRLASDGVADRASRRASSSSQAQEPNWEVYDVNTGETKFRFHALDGVEAVERQHLSAFADDRQFRVRPISQQGRQPRAAEMPPVQTGEQMLWWEICTVGGINGNIQAPNAEAAKEAAMRDWGDRINQLGGISHIRLISGLA